MDRVLSRIGARISGISHPTLPSGCQWWGADLPRPVITCGRYAMNCASGPVRGPQHQTQAYVTKSVRKCNISCAYYNQAATRFASLEIFFVSVRSYHQRSKSNASKRIGLSIYTVRTPRRDESGTSIVQYVYRFFSGYSPSPKGSGEFFN